MKISEKYFFNSTKDISEIEDTYNRMDPDKPSRAVISKGEKGGSVLWYVGLDICLEIDEGGCELLEDLGLDFAPIGISIWEGHYVDYDLYNTDECTTSQPEGSFRSLTEEEWELVKQNKPPWNEDDWMLKGKGLK